MLQITQLDKALKTYAGEQITTEDDKTPLTIKVALLNCLGSMKPDSGGDAVICYSLGTRIYEAETTDIKAHELTLLKQAVEQNTPQYMAFILGQLHIFLNTIEE